MHAIITKTSAVLQHIENIYTVLRKNDITFSKTEATKIVGSRTTLEKLVSTGKIRMKIQNEKYRKGQWKCNAEDVLRYASED